MQEQKRDQKIDIARGIAIFSVVLGHIATGLESHIIYLFHMPFFFILSGYFYRPEPQLGKYLNKKVLSLLIPYFIYLFILKFSLISEVFLNLITTPSGETAHAFIKYLYQLNYGGQTLRGTTGVFWFVTCLFLTQQLFNVIRTRTSSRPIMLAITGVLYGLAVFDQTRTAHLVAPWALNIVGCAFLFYTVGAFYGHYLFQHKNKEITAAAIAIATLSIILIISGVKLSFDMKHAYYGYFLISPLAALSLTKLLALITEFLSKNTWTHRILAYVGTASLTIMYLHRFIEYNLPRFLQGHPVFEAVIITLFCCALHGLILSTSLSRALFLGSFKDIKSFQLRPRLKASAKAN